MERQLTVRIVGPGVLEGKIGLRELQRIVHPLEQAVRALLPAHEPPAVARSKRRKPRARFLLSGIESGSAIADLELETEFDRASAMIDPDPIGRLLDGCREHGETLPEVVQGHLTRLARGLPEGVEFIELSSPTSGAVARLSRRAAEEQQRSTVDLRVVSGRLIEVDFRTGRARLQVPRASSRRAGPELLPLRFADELANDMQRLARQLVTVQGLAELNSSGVVQSLTVERISLEFDDRHVLWAPKRFRWPTDEELWTDVDVEEFLRTSRDDEGDE